MEQDRGGGFRYTWHVISKQVFVAPMGARLMSPAERRFVVALLAGVALATVPNLPAATSSYVHLNATPTASGGWLDRLNTWRASTGLSSLSEVPLWSTGDYNHSLYMVKNDLVTHYETPGTPYYTTDGDAASQNGNIQVSSTTGTSDQQAIDWWMAAPFHAMGMMDPRLTQTGFGSYREVKSGWQEGATLDVLRGNSFTGGNYPVYFPGNGTTEPLTTYSGGEFPDPLQACSGYTTPTGLPVFIEVGGNVATTAGPVHSFTGNGVALQHCIIDSTVPSVGSDLTGRGGVIVVPRQPLQSGVRYVVALTVNGVPYTWSFTVAPFLAVSGVVPDAGTAAGGTAVTISGAGFTGASSVKFGTTAATTFTVVNDTTITAVSPAHAVGAVDITVTTPLGTTPTLAADQFTYATPCTAVSIAAAPASPQAVGATITLTASATCPSANPQYEFWALWAGTNTWILQKAYSTSETWTWNSTGAPPGTEKFGVWVRDANSLGVNTSSTGRYDALASIPYTVGASGLACTAVSLAAAPASPQNAGTSITVTASATCPNASPKFQFVALWAGTSSWIVQQPYSTTTTWTWNSTGAPAGIERFGVWVKDAGSTNAYDQLASIPYTVTTQACTAVTLNAAPASTAPAGTSITVSASATCPNANPQFQFVALWARTNTWIIQRPYSTSNTWTWNSTGAPPGIERFGVWVRDAGSSAPYDAVYSIPYTVT
jgi:uncharacterized protein YkwD